MVNKMFEEAVRRAKRKRDRIIARGEDVHGFYASDEGLEALIIEEEKQRANIRNLWRGGARDGV